MHKEMEHNIQFSFSINCHFIQGGGRAGEMPREMAGKIDKYLLRILRVTALKWAPHMKCVKNRKGGDKSESKIQYTGWIRYTNRGSSEEKKWFDMWIMSTTKPRIQTFIYFMLRIKY